MNKIKEEENTICYGIEKVFVFHFRLVSWAGYDTGLYRLLTIAFSSIMVSVCEPISLISKPSTDAIITINQT